MAEEKDGIVIETDLDPKGFKAGSAELQKAIKSLGTKVNALGLIFQKAVSGSASAISSFKSKAQSLESTISEIEDKMEELADKKVPTDAYNNLQTAIGKADEKLYALIQCQKKLEHLGVDENSKQWQALQYDIESTASKLESYRVLQDNLVSRGEAFTLGSDTDEYAQLNLELETAKTNLESLQDDFRTPPTGLLDALRNATPLSEQLKNKLLGIVSAASRVGRSVLGALSGIAHPIRSLNSILGKLASGFAYVGKQALKFMGSMAKKAVVKLGSALKSAAQKMLTFKKNSGGAEGAVSKLGKKLTGLVGQLKRMVLRKIMSSMLSGVKDGMDNLAQYSSSVNANLSTLKSGLTQLKNSFATAFAPILSVVTPILSKLISYLSAAVTYIGKMIAALTGAKTFTKAVAVQEDYADSLNKTSKAAKETKKQLAGFDELNVLSDSSSGGSGSNGGVSPSEMFEEVPIESSISDFANKIRNAIENGDWEELGQLLGEKVNGIVQKVHDAISWDNVGPKITEFMNAFTTTFNSFVDTVDWKLIGDTIAQGINTIVNSLYLLIDGIDWNNLGGAIADGLSGLINGVDWKKLSETITLSLSAIGDAINGFAANFDWNGTAQAINNLFAGLDLDKATTDIANGLNKAISGLRTTLQGVKWEEIGKTLVDGINGIFKLDWSNIGGMLSDAISGLLKTLAGTLENFDWRGIADSIWEFIKGIEWGDIADSIFESLGAVFGGLSSFIVEVLSNAWNDVKNYFSQYVDWGDSPKDIVFGLLNGIIDAIKGIGTWIKEHIFQPFIDGFKKAFGIHSPSTVMAEQGGFIVDGLKNGIGDIWAKIKEKFTTFYNNVKTWFSEKVENFKKFGSNIISNIKSGVGNIWTSIKEKFSAFWTNMYNWFVGLKEKFSNRGAAIVSNIKSGIGNIWNSIKEKFSTFWTNITNWFNGKKDGLLNIGKKLISNISSGIGNVWNQIKSKFTTAIENIKKTFSVSTIKTHFNNVVEGIKAVFAKIPTWFKDKFSDAWTKVKNVFSKGGDTFKGITDGILNTFKTIVNGLIGGINNVIAVPFKAINTALTKVRDISIAGMQPFKDKISLINIPQIPKLAKGGIVDSATLAMIGEAGKEAVVPLENNTGWIKKIAQAISSEIQMHTYSFGEVGVSSSFVKTLDAFADKIDGSLMTMADRIQAIADRVTFTMPIAATGFVPYSVSASASNSDSDISTTIETSNQELGSVIIQTVTNATAAIVTAIENYSGTEVNLDMQSLTTGVINEHNRRARISGSSELRI
ncbi:MAG: hypothetical protein NC177_16380 [Ruminococcus flavefaciens]|nr:hypothetical protein [Ruminococcus flavefaciens]